MSKVDFSRLHGLIVGIDTYGNKEMHHDLQGCVNDATSMLEYFTKNLRVPRDHFRCLFNEEATRDKIVDTFCSHLIFNPAVEHFDPIVVYFAGHGATCFAMAQWQSEVVQENIETLVTYDADTKDAEGEYIWGIPDRALGELVYHLSQAKGNNITIILDSCHSGSGTRGDKVLVRSSQVRDSPPMPRHIYERKIRESLPDNPTELQQVTTSRGTARKLLAPSLETHILLAACRHDEKAQEVEARGVFTSALLESLRNCDLSVTGYSTLIRSVMDHTSRRKLPASKSEKPEHDTQTPQCEGRNQDRLIFSPRLSISNGKIALLTTEDEGIFRIKAGSAVGIVVGTEFGVFLDGIDATPAPIAQLFATDVGPTGALLKGLQGSSNSPLELPHNAYVSVIKYNNHPNSVRVLVHEKSALPAPWQEVFENLASQPVIWTKPGEPSDLILVPTKDGVELQRNTYSLEQPGPMHIQLKHDFGVNRLSHILAGAIRFHFYLQHENPEKPIQAKLGMKLQELETYGGPGRWRVPEYHPKGEDLFAKCLEDGTVTSVQADAKKLFGLTLTNGSDQGLFPYVLYYNLEDYSISCLYDPPSRSMKAPLPAAADGDPGSLSIGYGTGGSDAFNVELTNEKSQKEYGVFVLLVFNEWVDVAYLQRESPFDNNDNWVRSATDTKVPTGVWDKIAVRVSIYPYSESQEGKQSTEP